MARHGILECERSIRKRFLGVKFVLNKYKKLRTKHALSIHVGTRHHFSGYPTYQELTGVVSLL